MSSRSILLALLATSCLGLGCGGTEQTPSGPTGPRTVVLISLDTLRPERLGVYGNTEGPFPVSPHLDAFASEAAVFDQALASSPWTLPSHMTMLTGLDPIAHGVRNSDFAPQSPKIATLAQILDTEGFETGGFTDGGFVSGHFGFERGFDVYRDERDSTGGPNGFARLLPEALEWLRTRQAGDDVFLFLHTFDAHAPFNQGDAETLARFRTRPTPDGPRDWGLNILHHHYQQNKVGIGEYHRMSQLLNDYDAGVHDADRGVGQVIQALKNSGRFENALIIVTSDHGESFLDHGLHVGHGIGLKDDELRVPLIVRFPSGEGMGTRHDELVGLIDVSRTVLDVVGVEAPATMQGESLTGLVRGRRRKVDYVLGESQNVRSWFLVQNDYKYVTPVAVIPMTIAERHLGPQSPPCMKPNPEEHVYEIGQGDDAVELRYDLVGDPLGLKDVLPASEQLYDRTRDPGEQSNLAPEDPPALANMRRLFDGLRARSDELNAAEFFDPDYGGPPSMDAAAVRALAALGYLSTGDKKQLRDVPKGMREWVLEPWKAPDTRLLVEADRAVQRVRAKIAEGTPPVPADRDVLQQAGEDYVRWFTQHPHFRPRIDWRVVALRDLAELAGFELDWGAWGADLQDALDAVPKEDP